MGNNEKEVFINDNEANRNGYIGAEKALRNRPCKRLINMKWYI